MVRFSKEELNLLEDALINHLEVLEVRLEMAGMCGDLVMGATFEQEIEDTNDLVSKINKEINKK